MLGVGAGNALVLQLSLLNTVRLPTLYFPLTLQTWEQGRFIRFHGLIQWLGWSWPFALLIYLVRRLSMSPGHYWAGLEFKPHTRLAPKIAG